MQNPLILTLTLDTEALVYYTALRKAYFPPELNYLDAHLTLFHHLPVNQSIINDTLERITAIQNCFKMLPGTFVSIGNGVAIKFESDLLVSIHKTLQQQWQEFLIPQDKQKLWPHITIQNKVSAQQAVKTLEEVNTTYKPIPAYATGFTLWEYLNGPWNYCREYKLKT